MKENIDFWTDVYAISIGLVGAFLKGLKKKIKARTLFIQTIIGGILAYGTIGIVDQFFSDLNDKIVIVIAFAVGWAASEITEFLDEFIKNYLEKITDRLIKK